MKVKTNKMEKDIKRLIDEDSNYGRIFRWIFAIRFMKLEDFYQMSMDEIKNMSDEEKDKFTIYDFLINNLCIDMYKSYCNNISMSGIVNWANNYYLKANGYAITHPEEKCSELLDIAKEFKQDITDVINGLCEHWFTDEMRKKLMVKVVNYD